MVRHVRIRQHANQLASIEQKRQEGLGEARGTRKLLPSPSQPPGRRGVFAERFAGIAAYQPNHPAGILKRPDRFGMISLQPPSQRQARSFRESSAKFLGIMPSLCLWRWQSIAAQSVPALPCEAKSVATIVSPIAK